MRVVFLTHNYPRTPSDIAGTFLRPLAVALHARGHDVQVVAPSDGGRGGEETADGIRIHRVRYAAPLRERYAYTGRMQDALKSPAGWVAIGGMLRAMRRATRSLLNGVPSGVVHAHWWFPAGLAAPPERPCVVTLHGTDARLLANPAARLLARRALARPRVVTAVSQAVARLAEGAMGRAIDGDHVSPMPVATAGRPSPGGGGLVFVGRLTEQKRVPLLLEATALLRAEGRRVALTVVGDGPERGSLESRARAPGLDGSVRFLGAVAPAEVARTLETADAFVLPAQAEGLGLAAIEALTAGVPVVVCRDGGGLLDVVAEPGAGLAVDPDAGSLARALAALLDDPRSRERAWQAGLVWRDRLSPDRVAARCEAWYAEAARG